MTEVINLWTPEHSAHLAAFQEADPVKQLVLHCRSLEPDAPQEYVYYNIGVNLLDIEAWDLAIVMFQTALWFAENCPTGRVKDHDQNIDDIISNLQYAQTKTEGT